MARIENTNLPLAAKGTNSVGVSLICVLLCFLQGQNCLFILCLVILLISETQTFWKKLRISEKVTIGPFFCMNFFLYLLLCMNFFSWHFPLHEFFLFFFPTPDHFSNGASLKRLPCRLFVQATTEQATVRPISIKPNTHPGSRRGY